MANFLAHVKETLFADKRGSLRISVYLVTGVTVAIIQYTTFIFGLNISGRYFISSAFAFCLAVLSSFVLQRHITFAKQQERNIDTKQSFLLFILYTFVNLLINQSIMYTGVDVLGYKASWAQLASMVFLAVMNFTVYRYIFS